MRTTAAIVVLAALALAGPGAARATEVFVRAHTMVDLRVHADEPDPTITGVLRRDCGQPVAGEWVQIDVPGLRSQTAVTGSAGDFAVTFAAADLPWSNADSAAPLPVHVYFGGSARHGPSHAAAVLDRLRAPTALDVRVRPTRARPGERVQVHATLGTTAGSARLANATLEVRLTAAADGAEFATATAVSDAHGAATAELTTPHAWRPGALTVTVSFAGDTRHAPTTSHAPLGACDAATLTLTAHPEVDGGSPHVTARAHLASPAGPLAGVPIEFTVRRGGATTMATRPTDRTGAAVWRGPAPGGAYVDVTAQVHPSATDVCAPTVALPPLLVPPTPGLPWRRVVFPAVAALGLVGLVRLARHAARWARRTRLARRTAPAAHRPAVNPTPGPAGLLPRAPLDSALLHIQVRDRATGAPWPGATVRVTGNGSDPPPTAADAAGTALFAALGPGRYAVHVHAAEALPHTTVVDLPRPAPAAPVTVRLWHLRGALLSLYRAIAHVRADGAAWGHTTPRESLDRDATGAALSQALWIEAFEAGYYGPACDRAAAYDRAIAAARAVAPDVRPPEEA